MTALRLPAMSRLALEFCLPPLRTCGSVPVGSRLRKPEAEAGIRGSFEHACLDDIDGDSTGWKDAEWNRGSEMDAMGSVPYTLGSASLGRRREGRDR